MAKTPLILLMSSPRSALLSFHSGPNAIQLCMDWAPFDMGAGQVSGAH